MFARKRRPDPPRTRNPRRPALEPLEGRQLMSLGSEFVGPLNTTTRNAQFDSDTASSANGSSVVVWVDTFSSTDRDIRAQRLSSTGAKIGPEIVVSASGLDESAPAVAMDNSGNFVVTWVQNQSGGDTNVLARRFNASGTPQGSIVQVGVGTFREHDPDVAMDAQGRFAVAYTRDTNNNNPDVFAKRYDASGNLQSVVNVATGSRAEDRPSIAMAPDGRFNVAWEEAFSSSDHDIKMNRYSSAGTFSSGHVISVSTANDARPSVAMDNFGNSVVAWERAGDIKAMRVSSFGSQSGVINIASSAAGERNASVALKRSGGGFVVAYDSSLLFLSTRVKVAEVSSTNVVTTLDAGQRSGAAVSINGFNDYQLTYTASDGGDLNIRGRRGKLL